MHSYNKYLISTYYAAHSVQILGMRRWPRFLHNLLPPPGIPFWLSFTWPNPSQGHDFAGHCFLQEVSWPSPNINLQPLAANYVLWQLLFPIWLELFNSKMRTITGASRVIYRMEWGNCVMLSSVPGSLIAPTLCCNLPSRPVTGPDNTCLTNLEGRKGGRDTIFDKDFPEQRER